MTLNWVCDNWESAVVGGSGCVTGSSPTSATAAWRTVGTGRLRDRSWCMTSCDEWIDSSNRCIVEGCASVCLFLVLLHLHCSLSPRPRAEAWGFVHLIRPCRGADLIRKRWQAGSFPGLPLSPVSLSLPHSSLLCPSSFFLSHLELSKWMTKTVSPRVNMLQRPHVTKWSLWFRVYIVLSCGY